MEGIELNVKGWIDHNSGPRPYSSPFGFLFLRQGVEVALTSDWAISSLPMLARMSRAGFLPWTFPVFQCTGAIGFAAAF